MTSPTVTALVDRRRDIMREIMAAQQEIGRCENQLYHLDSTIRLLEPDFDFTAIRAKKLVNQDLLFRPGELPLMAMDVIREAGSAVTTTQVTDAVIAKRTAEELSAANIGG